VKPLELILTGVSIMVLVIYTIFVAEPPVAETVVTETATVQNPTVKTFVITGQASVQNNQNFVKVNTAEKQMENKQEEPVTELAVPWRNSDFKAYMPYDSITDKTAPQWRYRQLAWTDINGLRRVGDDYLVAMGTYYTESVGARFLITLDTGSEFTVKVGDIKNPAHTDTYNMYTPVRGADGKIISANVLEFLVDTDKLDEKAALLGTVSCIAGLEGNVEKIAKLENSNTGS
jgi:hypothetical protein